MTETKRADCASDNKTLAGPLCANASGSNGVVDTFGLLARTRAMLPAIKARAYRAEQSGQIPDSTIQEIRDAQLLRVGVPTRYRGPHFGDVDYDSAFQLTFEIARGCASTAWVYALYAAHNWMVSMTFPEETLDEYFADPDVLCASSFSDPTAGKLTPVSGGYRLTGSYSFSSGCDAASWNYFGATAPDGAKKVLVPRDDWEIDPGGATACPRPIGGGPLPVRPGRQNGGA